MVLSLIELYFGVAKTADVATNSGIVMAPLPQIVLSLHFKVSGNQLPIDAVAE